MASMMHNHHSYSTAADGSFSCALLNNVGVDILGVVSLFYYIHRIIIDRKYIKCSRACSL